MVVSAQHIAKIGDRAEAVPHLVINDSTHRTVSLSRGRITVIGQW